MIRATLLVAVGLGQDPAGDCLGLRYTVTQLATWYPIDPIFLSHKTPVSDAVAAIEAAGNQKRIHTGHSLGADLAYKTAIAMGGANALGIWEPVPESDAFNGGYKFAPLPGMRIQNAIRIDGPFPIAWGREFSDDSLNMRIHPWMFTGLIANCHSEICKRPEITAWYENAIIAVCESASLQIAQSGQIPTG